MKNLSVCLLLAGLGTACFPNAAVATPPVTQWTVLNFHPQGADASYGIGGGPGSFVGSIARTSVGVLHAAIWNESTGGWIDLNPGLPEDRSEAVAVRANQQVGFATVGGVRRASLWNGSAAAWIDMHPVEGLSSAALAIDGNQQAGYVELPTQSPSSNYRASLWNGSSNWIDLSPAESESSCVYTMYSGRQGGYAFIGNEYHACLWSGTSSSWVDLKPTFTPYSIVYNMDSRQQVGVIGAGMYEHASVWSGSAQSVVDLNPPGVDGSRAQGVLNQTQVGLVYIDDATRASLWRGSAESWIDLHAFLPSAFTSSSAESIWSDGRAIYVLGYGFNSSTRRDEAVLWIGTAACPCDLNNDGRVDDNDFSTFVDAYNTLDCASPLMPTGCPADFTGDQAVDDSDFAIFVAGYDAMLCP